jgi:hypothetical protein
VVIALFKKHFRVKNKSTERHVASRISGGSNYEMTVMGLPPITSAVCQAIFCFGLLLNGKNVYLCSVYNIGISLE